MRHRIGRLHVITDSRFGRTHAEIAAAAIAGGADTIQLREKDATTRDVLDAARDVGALCRRHHVPLIINDRIDIALAMDADGVHLGDEDLPIEIARSLFSPDRIIGSSADNPMEVERRFRAGADYVGIGPIFGTSSKLDTGPVLGLVGLANAVKQSELPLIAIGGITSQNLADVLATGVYGVAILSAICGNDDPQAAARDFREKIDARAANEHG